MNAIALTAHRLPPQQSQSTQTILVVDDDSAIRTVTALMLKCQGFKTFSASNGLEALHALERHPEINAVLLDVLMPVMNGEEAFREMRRSWPDVRVILVSGFVQNEIDQRFGTPPPDGFMQKPFTFEKLTGALCGALN
jgi:CheY-like chemotaxis protein